MVIIGQYSRKLKRGIRWYYSGQYLGQRYFSKAIYLTKNECKKAERDQIAELDAESRRPKSNITLLEAMNARLDYLEGKSTTYYKDNKRYFKMFLESAGNKPITDITKLDINIAVQAYSDDLKKRNKTQHKANAYVVALKALFNHAIDLYDLDIKNPASSQKKRAIDKKIKFIPTDQMISEVKEKCDKEEILLINFVMQTGARISECLKFTAEDVLDDTIVLYTRKSRNSDLVGRKIPIPECIEGLRWKGRLFKRWTEYPRFLEKTVKELKQPFWAWHGLRHRYASRLSKEGRPIFEIMLLLGHSNLSTTQGYLQLLP